MDKLRSKVEPYMKVRVDAAVCQKYLESISLNERYQWLTIFPITDKIDPFGISCKNKGQREGLGDKFAFFFLTRKMKIYPVHLDSILLSLHSSKVAYYVDYYYCDTNTLLQYQSKVS